MTTYRKHTADEDAWIEIRGSAPNPLPEGWRPLTRSERFWRVLFEPRFSLMFAFFLIVLVSINDFFGGGIAGAVLVGLFLGLGLSFLEDWTKP